ncbi:Phosphoenolpyruvate-dihydroxyacetone phosphotransferase, dihydroxyacetone binding subunit DhaK [Streptococcus sp. HSISS2]|nr:Phosphoenolpyruvate-dihydroxyacetone phosphotransferase, dihydroxyacetone binding subunit DhaK [Streptococcus sp. HSISS2]
MKRRQSHEKIINKPENVVTEMLDGLAYVHSDLVHRVEGFDIIARNEQAAGQVGLISGGGSGHEPAHAGFVGDGMLSAAIAGAVFTSPTPDQILEAIKEADQGAGVFMVVKNYSGDIMNFEMAQELAEMEGIEVASIVVDDDIAVENSLYTQGRRGVAGTIFVHKILGHAAREGKSLAEIKDLADKIVPNIHTIGLALSGATVPEVGKPGFVLAEDEIEYGIGIHGEPGYRKESMQPSRQLAEELTGKLLEAFEAKTDERYALLINGMGATPLMEQYVFANDVASILGDAGLDVVYRKLGNYMTSIDMAGLSLTLMKIDDDAWLEALESPVKTIAW